MRLSIADKGKVALARHAFAYLHRLFRWSVSRQIIAASPMQGLEKPGPDPDERDRKLTDEELRLAWLAASGLGYPFQHAIRLLILTGARRSEIGNLKWEEISWRSPKSFSSAVINGYRRDYWDQQPHRVEVWSEKGTVRGVLARC